jgi:ferric-dicitrate binding protein FerR (iron transport regulator)
MTRLEDLVERQLDGELARAEQDELAALLADADHRRTLARMMALHGALAGAAAPAGATAPAPGPLVLPPRRGWRGGRRALAAAGLALLLGLGAVIALRAGAPGPDAWSVAGAGPAATVVHGERELPATAGMALAAGDRLRGPATLLLADGSRLESGEDTLLETLGQRPGVRLLAGRVAVTAHPRPAGPALAVETQFGTAEVHGTRYTVVADALRTVVSVAEGTVALRRGMDAPLLLPAGSGGSASASAARRFSLPAGPWAVDFAHAGADWSGRAVDGGRMPAFHHRDEAAAARPVWGIVSPPAGGSGYLALGRGVALDLTYDLAQACDAFILLGIVSAADSGDFRGNLQADVHLADGLGQRLHLAPERFTLRTGEVPLARGDEVVGQAYLMVMDGDHQLVVRAFALAPGGR